MSNFGSPPDPPHPGPDPLAPDQTNPLIGDPILPPSSPAAFDQRGGPAAMGHAHYPDQSQSIMVFILGLFGLLACQLLAPFAWRLGNQELAAIDAGRRDPIHRGLAQVGRIMGMVGTALIAIAVIAVVLLLVGSVFFVRVG